MKEKLRNVQLLYPASDFPGLFTASCSLSSISSPLCTAIGFRSGCGFDLGLDLDSKSQKVVISAAGILFDGFHLLVGALSSFRTASPTFAIYLSAISLSATKTIEVTIQPQGPSRDIGPKVLPATCRSQQAGEDPRWGSRSWRLMPGLPPVWPSGRCPLSQ